MLEPSANLKYYISVFRLTAMPEQKCFRTEAFLGIFEQVDAFAHNIPVDESGAQTAS